LNDSNDEQTVKELLSTVNIVLRMYFDVRRQRRQNELDLANKQSALVAEFEKLDQPLSEREAELAASLREQLIPNRVRLLTGKLKSFATTYGSVSWVQKRETLKVIDPKGLEKMARRDRKLGMLGKFVREWKHDAKKVAVWLKANPDQAKRYEPFVKRDGGYDELFVQSNDAYIKEFDPNRLTDKSVNLGPVDDNKDAEDNASPDA
jgi:phage host-nuclease inhibitor protein Gam